MSTHRLIASLCVTVALGVAATAIASGDATPPPDDLLRGPRVVDEGEGRRGMPMKGFDGTAQLPEGRPEVVVLASMSLSDDERAATDAILTARGVALRGILAEHTDLLLELQSLRQSGDRAGVRDRLSTLRGVAEPLIAPPLVDQLAISLSSENAERFRSAVAAHRRTLREQMRPAAAPMSPDGAPAAGMPTWRENAAADAMGDATDDVRPRGRAVPRRQAVAPAAAEFEEVILLVRELAMTLASEVEFRQETLAEFLELIDATPEQAERIRAIVRESAPSRRGGSEARAQIFGAIMPLLTDEQRRAAMRHLRRG